MVRDLHIQMTGSMQVVSVARALGLDEADLPASSIDEAIDFTLSEYGTAGPAYKASMLVDFLAERPMEIEVIIGGILRYAGPKQVPTPGYAMFMFGLPIVPPLK